VLEGGELSFEEGSGEEKGEERRDGKNVEERRSD
jgi:hypothetical protein